jgi:hypothetical protein
MPASLAPVQLNIPVAPARKLNATPVPGSVCLVSPIGAPGIFVKRLATLIR